MREGRVDGVSEEDLSEEGGESAASSCHQSGDVRGGGRGGGVELA